MPCLIAAPASGSGKTLLSLLLAALARSRGLALQPFKVGPDYLDPQLLSRVSGLSCRNLDPLLCGEQWLRQCFHWHGSRAPLTLVEGVMGLFDGLGPSSRGSSAAVAAQLDLPVVLVVEASRQAGSLAALVRGFRDHGPPPVRLAGVVLNRVGSERHRALLREALASISMPLLGVLPSDQSLELPSRHLGLLPPGELSDLAERQRRWAHLAERHLDLDALWPLLQSPSPLLGAQDPIDWCLAQAQSSPGLGLSFSPTVSNGEVANGEFASGEAASPLAMPSPLGVPGLAAGPGMRPGAGRASSPQPLPIAVASDAAFHFRYPEATELLQALGLEPLPWSPLADDPLPAGCRAVLLPGGYPELHAAQLAASGRSLRALRTAANQGLPIAAECGGLLLLGRELLDPDGIPHAMAGLLPFSAARGALSLGYRQATACRDGLLVRRGETLWAHEFHRWQLLPAASRGPISSTGPKNSFDIAPELPNEPGSRANLWQVEGWGVPPACEGWTTTTLHATWLHLHWAGCPEIPLRLAAASARAVPLPWNAASCPPPTPAPASPVSAGG
ncbi:MAG TPA: cobyrinate a,c-diamide synthase [Synechococcales bacterium UBA10510]|nr:cobyrinate a,c-diamide synthase [Synechococcales bacterium UBA10510]